MDNDQQLWFTLHWSKDQARNNSFSRDIFCCSLSCWNQRKLSHATLSIQRLRHEHVCSMIKQNVTGENTSPQQSRTHCNWHFKDTLVQAKRDGWTTPLKRHLWEFNFSFWCQGTWRCKPRDAMVLVANWASPSEQCGRRSGTSDDFMLRNVRAICNTWTNRTWIQEETVLCPVEQPWIGPQLFSRKEQQINFCVIHWFVARSRTKQTLGNFGIKCQTRKRIEKYIHWAPGWQLLKQ